MPTLRTYLGALLLLFALTELVGNAYLRGQSEDSARRNAATSAQFSAELAASEVAAALVSVETSVTRTAANPGIVPAFQQATPCNLVFGAAGPFESTHLDFLKLDGSIACSSLPALSPGVGYAGASWFTSALVGQTFAGPITDARTGARSAVFSAPVAGAGMVAAFVDLANLGPVLATRFGGPSQPEFLIVSADGTSVISRSIEPTRWAGASLATAPFRIASDPADHPDLDGVSRIYGQSTVGSRGWIVFAGVPSDRALAAASSTTLAALGVSSVMLLVLLIATLVIYRAITLPLGRLARSVRAGTTSGRLEPVPVAGPKEVADLARDFNGFLAERRAFEQAHDALESRMRQSERLESVGRLVGGIAHDFNNLLSIVLNYTDFISRRLPADDPNQPDLAQIQAAGERATRLTRQLLTFARRGPVRNENVSLNALIEQLRDLLKSSLNESIAIDLRLGERSWPVHADHGQMEQLLLNLVVNAGDAMPDGGRLVIATSNVDLDEHSARQYADLAPGRYVQLTVTDSGIGMPQEVLDLAFEPFFTTKGPGKGTGLGLATTYGVVQQAGGRISLYSEVGKGTTVRVLLPASATVDLEPLPAAAKAARLDGARGTILVVEDEERVREAAARILVAASYDVTESRLPEEALTLMSDATKSLDLLLTDMVMPGMSGRELARRLRLQRPGLRVIFMTGYSEELLQHEAGIAEDTVIHKPFTREPLLAAVAAAIAR